MVDESLIAEFWDLNPQVSLDQHFWMAHPLCRRAINIRVSGAENTWPLDYLYAQAGSPRFDLVLSLGCGMGHVERAIRRLGIARSVDAIDGSPVSISLATRKAEDESLDGIAYRVADLNRVSFPNRKYDAVVFHQSLHHVKEVERLLAIVTRTLKPEGFLFLEEWTGPSRTQWNASRLTRLGELFQEIPLRWRKWSDLRPPIEEHDPTEAVRSSAIRPTVRRLFEVLVDCPYGGQIVSVLLPQLHREHVPQAELDGMISRWLALESEELAANPDASFYNATLAVPRHGLRAMLGRVANGLARIPHI